MKLTHWIVLLAGIPTGIAWAQANPVRLAPLVASTDAAATLRSELTVNQVITLTDGKESLRSAAEVKPNDLLQYTTTYTNNGTRPVKNLVASLPIPPGTAWVNASATPRKVTASTDGKVFLALPLMRQIKHPDGHVSEELIPLTEYRALRWAEQVVEPGATYTVSARVRVSALGAPAVSATPGAATGASLVTASTTSLNTTAGTRK